MTSDSSSREELPFHIDPEARHRVAATQAKRSPWLALRRLISWEWIDIRSTIVFAIVVSILSLVPPIAVQSLVNTIAMGGLFQPLLVLTLAVLAALLLTNSVALINAYAVEVLQRKVFVRLAETLAERLPFVAAHERDSQNMNNRANLFIEVISVQKSLASLLVDGTGQVFQILAGLVLLGFYHPIFLVFDVILIVLFSVVLLFGRGGAASAVKESSAKHAVISWVQYLARAGHQKNGQAQRDYLKAQTRIRIQEYLDYRTDHFRQVFSLAIGGFFMHTVALISLLGIGGWLVMNRELSLGQLIAAEIVIGATAYGLAKLGSLSEKLFDLAAAADKLVSLLEVQILTQGKDRLSAQAAPLQLSVEALTLRYADSNVVLGPFDFSAAKGAKVVLADTRGAGKSALLEALAGRREFFSGSIFWDSSPVPDRSDLANAVALLDQQRECQGSIASMLQLEESAESLQKTYQLLDLVGLKEVVQKLPQGLHSALRPNGQPLSPRETSRLHLAAALVTNPRLLLIDESIDDLGLDSDAEKRLFATIFSPHAPWTLVIATNRADIAAMGTNVVAITMPSLQSPVVALRNDAPQGGAL